MAKLDLDWLGVFVEIYKTQSVSRAAQRLGMEQASASIALAKLRRHFDDRLFSRTSQGMEPPVPLPKYKVKQHWHERFNADVGNIWLRKTMATLFSATAPGA